MELSPYLSVSLISYYKVQEMHLLKKKYQNYLNLLDFIYLLLNITLSIHIDDSCAVLSHMVYAAV